MKSKMFVLFLLASALLGVTIGRWSVFRPDIKVDVEFVPDTGTADNPWGFVLKIETYYLRNGKRILEGEQIEFLHGSGVSFTNVYKDGEIIGLRGGPAFPFDLPGSPSGEEH